MHVRGINATNPFVFTLTASSHIATTGYKLLIYTHNCWYSTTTESWNTDTKSRVTSLMMYRNVSNFPFRLSFLLSSVLFHKNYIIDF